MDFQRSTIQPSKKIKIEEDVKQDDLEAACGVDIWKEAPEELLLEIFIRLPDFQSAIRAATVCHKWHSLISHSPLFIQRFTIMFRKVDDGYYGFSPQDFQPICKLYSDQESMYCTSPDFLDFIMPSSSSPMVIRGSCNDLLLVSPGSRGSTQLYICNPYTKQSIQLPEIPRPPRDRRNFNDIGVDNDVAGHALVCMSPGPSSQFRFKVVEFQNAIFRKIDSNNVVQPIMLYCSESREWEMRHLHYPRPRIRYSRNWLHGVACKGTLYWLECGHFGVNRVIYLDLSNYQCGAIDFPDDYCRGTHYPRHQIGVVRGEELRLLQVVLTKPKERTVDLKVWRLSHEKEWILVHHKKKLEKPERRSYQALPFVHPTDGDVVFLVWGLRIFEYDLRDTNTSTYEFISKLQEFIETSRVVDETPRDRLLQFPVVHTFWPTQILTA